MSTPTFLYGSQALSPPRQCLSSDRYTTGSTHIHCMPYRWIQLDVVVILTTAVTGEPTREARGCWPWGRGATITPLLLDQPTLAIILSYENNQLLVHHHRCLLVVFVCSFILSVCMFIYFEWRIASLPPASLLAITFHNTATQLNFTLLILGNMYAIVVPSQTIQSLKPTVRGGVRLCNT